MRACFAFVFFLSAFLLPPDFAWAQKNPSPSTNQPCKAELCFMMPPQSSPPIIADSCVVCEVKDSGVPEQTHRGIACGRGNSLTERRQRAAGRALASCTGRPYAPIISPPPLTPPPSTMPNLPFAGAWGDDPGELTGDYSCLQNRPVVVNGDGKILNKADASLSVAARSSTLVTTRPVRMAPTNCIKW
jgi:hypothetical protein